MAFTIPADAAAFPAKWELRNSLAFVTSLAASQLSEWLSRFSLLCLGSLVAVAVAFIEIWVWDFGAVKISRNFYGSIRVTDRTLENGFTKGEMAHGSSIHGSQILERPNLGTAYFSANSGVARELEIARQVMRAPLNIAVVGLGVGTLMTYGQKGDKFKFFERDPQVLDLANSYFSFLRDSDAEVGTIIAGGRRVLESDGFSNYDAIIIDAFSGSAILTHLLTKEALKLYIRKLAKFGILMLHISNSHVDLRPLPACFAEARGLTLKPIESEPTAERKHYEIPSLWSFLASFPETLSNDELNVLATDYTPLVGFEQWTDCFSNIFERLK